MTTLVDSEDLLTDCPKTPTASAGGDVLPKLPLQQQSEWTTRLDSLKTQHQSEIFQQQEEHLRQLQSLQAQLLLELSGDGTASPSSPLLLLTGALATPSTAHEEVLSGNETTHGGGESQTNWVDSQTILSVQNASPPEVYHSDKTTPSTLPAMVDTAHPSSPPLHQLSSDPPHHSSSSQDCIHPTVPPSQQEPSLLDTSNVSPSHSVEFLQLPMATSLPRTSSTNSVATASSLDSQAGSRAVFTSTDISGIPGMVDVERSSELQQAPPQDGSQLSESGSRYHTIAEDPPTLPGRRQAGRSHYPGGTPTVHVSRLYTTPPKLAAVSFTPHSLLSVPSLCPLPLTPGSLTPSRTTESRTSLVGKHMKHVEDLKQYYESELSLLRGKVEQLEGAARSPHPMSHSPFSPLKSGDRGRWRDSGETAQLKIQCSDLQSKLDETMR